MTDAGRVRNPTTFRADGRRGATTRRRFRLTITIIGLVAGTIALAGCEPDPQAQPFQAPGADWTVLSAINDSGLAVGTMHDTRVYAFTYDTTTSVTTVLPDPPPMPGLPSGGEFSNALDVNDAGLVLGRIFVPGGDRLAIYAPDSGTWQFPDCGTYTGLGHGSLSNSGLVACGDQVYDTTNQTFIDVVMPPDCAGTVRRVNAMGLAVGTCSAGTEPLFATRLADASTIGFGSDQGLPVSTSGTASPGSLTDTGWFVVTDDRVPTPHALVFRIQSGTSSVEVQPVDLGPLQQGPSIALAISPNGTVAIAHQVGDTWVSGTYGVVTGRLRALDMSALPGGAHYPGTFIVGINDAGTAVGFQTDSSLGTPYQSFTVDTVNAG